MNKLTDFDKEQLRICREHIKNDTGSDLEWWKGVYESYIKCLKDQEVKDE